MKASSLKFYFSHPVHACAKAIDLLYRQFHTEIPWISPRSIKFLEARLSSKGFRGFEWGSGNSTLWFSQFCDELISIEYDEKWFELVQEKLITNKTQSVKLFLIELEHDKSMPTYANYSVTPNYVSAIHHYPEKHFDFVIVDGHYRQACVLAAIAHLKPGGLLIIDNYNRIKTREEWRVPSSYNLVHCSSNIVTTTAIFEAL